MDYGRMFDISGKTALITGAGSGIGRGIALAFGKLGCSVAAVDLDRNGAEGTAEEIEAAGGRALSLACDVRDPRQVAEAVAKTLGEFGGIDVLVNNAGIGRRNKAEEMTEEDWDSVLDVNLKGAFLFSREAGKAMIERGRGGGRIINISSISAIVGLETGNANYAASKGGMVSMARCLAVEWAKYNILVNTILPTHTRTPLIEKLIKDRPEAGAYFLNNILLGRLAEVDDLVGPAVFLASDAASFITGQTIIVDGGHTAR
jgi:NAD(P)-dependent dehydrogenase (short-subunit alcohol dehydrogenase family)